MRALVVVRSRSQDLVGPFRSIERERRNRAQEGDGSLPGSSTNENRSIRFVGVLFWMQICLQPGHYGTFDDAIARFRAVIIRVPLRVRLRRNRASTCIPAGTSE